MVFLLDRHRRGTCAGNRLRGGQAGLFPFDGSRRGQDDARCRHARGGDKRSRCRKTFRAHGPFRRCPGTQAGVQFRPGGRSRAVDRLAPMSDVPQRSRDGGACLSRIKPGNSRCTWSGFTAALPRRSRGGAGGHGPRCGQTGTSFLGRRWVARKEYGKIISLPQNKKFAWDVYFIFGRQAKWTNSPPKPDFWMHQLGGPKRATCSMAKSSAKRSSVDFPDSAQSSAKPLSGAVMSFALFASHKAGGCFEMVGVDQIDVVAVQPLPRRQVVGGGPEPQPAAWPLACLTNVCSFSFSALGIEPLPRHLKNDRQFSLTTGTRSAGTSESRSLTLPSIEAKGVSFAPRSRPAGRRR